MSCHGMTRDLINVMLCRGMTRDSTNVTLCHGMTRDLLAVQFTVVVPRLTIVCAHRVITLPGTEALVWY